MEIKKTEDANLENKRTTRLLLGLVISLALLYVALEYTSTDKQQALSGNDYVEEWSEDLQPVVIEDELITVVPEKTVEVPEKLKIQDDAVSGTEMDLSDDSLKAIAAKAFVAEFDDDDFMDILPPENSENSQPVFRVVEELPQFPGGMTEFIKWLSKNLRYPYISQKNKVQGKVLAQFIVNADGSISDIRIVSSLDAYCDRETKRVLRLMPKWKAGVHNDKPCRTQVCVPVVFKM